MACGPEDAPKPATNWFLFCLKNANRRSSTETTRIRRSVPAQRDAGGRPDGAVAVPRRQRHQPLPPVVQGTTFESIKSALH